MPRFGLALFIPSFAALTALSCPGIAAKAAAPPAPKPLRLEWIMRGPELYGTEPNDVRWSLDSKQVFFRWKEPGEPLREPVHWYIYDISSPGGAKPRRLSDAEAESVPPRFAIGDPATSATAETLAVLYERDGGLYRVENNARGIVRLTNTPAVRESDPRFIGKAGDVVYRQGDNLFRIPTGPDGVTATYRYSLRTRPERRTPEIGRRGEWRKLGFAYRGIHRA